MFALYISLLCNGKSNTLSLRVKYKFYINNILSDKNIMYNIFEFNKT